MCRFAFACARAAWRSPPSAAHETAMRYGAWCVSQSDLSLLGSRTNLGGHTHDPTLSLVTRVHDRARARMGGFVLIVRTLSPK